MAALTFSSCSSSGASYRTETELTGAKIIVGKFSRSVLEADSAFHWFPAAYARYTPEQTPLEHVKSRAAELRFVLFIGTWCGDSKAEVPKMYKIFDALKIPAAHITMFGMDRMKNSGHGEAADFSVTKVPTLIVFVGDAEIGRIVEQPREGIEADISRMLQNTAK